MTFSIMMASIMTISITALVIMTLSVITLTIIKKCDTQYKIMLIVTVTLIIIMLNSTCNPKIAGSNLAYQLTLLQFGADTNNLGGGMTLSIMTFSIMTESIATSCIKAPGIITLCVITLTIIKKCDTLYKIMLIVTVTLIIIILNLTCNPKIAGSNPAGQLTLSQFGADTNNLGGGMTLSIMTFSIMTESKATSCIKALVIITHSVITLTILC